MVAIPDITRLNEIAQFIYDKKGKNIIALDVREVSSLTEYFVIAEGTVERNVAAIARGVIEQQKERGFPLFHTEGLAQGDWVVIDLGHIIVHLFTPDLREKYSLESLWKSGDIVDLTIRVGKDHE